MLRNSASDLPALYPSLDDVQAEIVHIEDLQTRPAECEIFMSDLHGEERGFLHCLKSAHGLVRTHIQESFRGGPTPVLKSEDEVNALCVLIYYPERCLFDNCLSRGVVSTNVTHSFFFPVSSNATGARQQGWYTRALELLIRLFTVLTRRLLRSAWVARCSMVLDRGPSHIRALYQTYLEDLILQSHAQGSTRFVSLTQTLFDHDMEQCKRWEASKSQSSPAALPFLAFVCHTLPLLCYDRLHVVGDIYDRGSGADVIMDALMSTFDRSSSSSFMPFDPACSVMGRPIMDFQWGNHDMLWFAAWAGSDVALCCVLRISLRYLNLRTLHEGYGVDLQELENFANKWYKDDPCQCFRPKRSNERTFTESDCALYARMQKAIAIIQFKLEEQWITRSPDAFACKHRHLLAGIHAGKTSIVLDNERFSLLDGHFPTLDVTSQETVERLTEDEARTLESLRKSFNRSERLRSHMAFLVRCGSMYAIRGDALMFHASIPMCTDGTLRDCRSILEDGLRVTLSEKSCPQLEKSPRLPQGPIRGKMYLDVIDSVIRHAWNVSERKHRCALPVNRNDPLVVLHTELCDFLYYLWTGALSPLFGKTRMATFERYFIADPRAHREPGDPYYRHRTKKDSVSIILKDFGIHPERGFIVNGHTPVKVKKGESAVKAGGHVLVIDGGFSEAYQSETGIAGFSLVTDAAGAAIVQHRKYPGEERILSTGEDMVDVIQPIRDHTQIVKTWDPAEEKQLVQLKTKLVALRTQYEQMGTATRRMQAHL